MGHEDYLEKLVIHSLNKLRIMNLKNFVFGIFFFVAISSFSQIKEEKEITTALAVTEFNLKTSNIEEFKNFDWIRINEIFENNDADQIIKLAFEYENPSKKRNSKPNVKNLKFELAGTTDQLSELIEKSKTLVSKFIEINQTYN